jgi:hypothetical protein
LAVDDAENPLQLLARASDLHVSPKPSSNHVAVEAPSRPRSRPNRVDEKTSDFEQFFTLSQFSLDTGSDLDPINLGLITEDEAETLFAL